MGSNTCTISIIIITTIIIIVLIITDINASAAMSLVLVQIHVLELSGGPGPLWSNIASVRSLNIFWTRLGPCVAFALMFLFIKATPTIVEEAFIFYL